MTASRRLLAVHPGALGDVILFGRLLEHLRRLGRAGRIVLAAGGQKARLLLGLGVVDDVLDFDLLPMEELFFAEEPDDSRLRAVLESAGPFDGLVSCFPSTEQSGVCERLGAWSGAEWSGLLPVRPPAGYERHLVACWLDGLRLPGCEADLGNRAWPVPAAWRQGAREQLERAGVGGGYVAIHPGAGGEAKCLPAETMLDLAGQIRKGGRQVVFLFGPIERERWAEAVQDRYRRVGPVLSDLSLPDLAGVLSQAGGFVGMDSGPGHLAGALGTKTLVIFITTHSGNFRPIGPSVDVLSGGAAERFSAIRKILL